MIHTVLISESLHSEGLRLLEERDFLITTLSENSQRAFEEALPDAEAVVLRTNVAMTRDSIDKASKLKIIARTGAGVDNVDVKAATAKGILVCNLVGVNSVSVAEHTVALILSLGKQLPFFDRSVRAGDWQARRAKVSLELRGKTVGVVAMGNVGAKVAQMCHEGFGMRILAYDPFVQDKFADYDYRFVEDLRTLFGESDFVTLHCPNLPETRGLAGREMIGVMKPTAFLINAARGEIIDEPALIEALRERRIAGAGIDVFATEPLPIDHPLCKLDNVILTPHCASLTNEVTAQSAVGAAQAIIDFADGKEPQFVFNKRELSGQ
jgi:D-3-phosphoglycerate dehydrogenase